MSIKRSKGLPLLLLTIGLLLSACAGGAAAVPDASEPPATTVLPTTTIPPTDTPVPPTPSEPPPTPTEPPPTPTELPPTATPTEAPVTLNPSPRGYIRMAYDSESKQVILFGGQIGDSMETIEFSGETWAFDITNQEWMNMKPTESPGLGCANPIAYDSESDRIILYGQGATGRDTWAYDYNTNTWAKMKGRGPAYHIGADMAYDVESDRVILFGGLSFESIEYFNDTWAYDYNTDTWTEMKPETSPPGQNFHAMTYDAAADRIISWGGDNVLSQPPPGYPPKDSRIWMYDYNTNTWQGKSSEGAPGARPAHGLAYVDSADLVYMYGGYEGGTREMRTYDSKSNTWAFIDEPIPFPGALSRFAMVYVPDADQIIVYGGQVGGRQFSYTNNTWVYDVSTNTWTNVTREEP